jgi:Flp pilus assembly protein TadD
MSESLYEGDLFVARLRMTAASQLAFSAARIGLSAALVAGLLLGACTAPSKLPSIAPLAPTDEEPSQIAPKRGGESADRAAAANRADPEDPATAIAHARELRAGNARGEALAVLDRASAAKPADRRLLLERGLLALELGDAAKAEKLLRQAHDPKAPDWRLHSALGAALASRGKQQEAQEQLAKALALAPDQPSVLNNLALSYALDGKAVQAEQLLRKAQRSAGATPQMQENLALVLGLRGRYDEAQSAGQAALPPAKAEQNVAYLRELGRARSAAAPAEAPTGAVAGDPARKASASLPQPSYQLGGPRAAE